MRKIKVCPGIGDNIWLLQKLVNAGEKFHFLLPDGRPQRGKQIFDLLPSVSGKSEYVPLKMKEVEANNVQRTRQKWSDIRVKEFFLSANKHLEAGRRIEKFLPDLPTSFKIDWDTERFACRAADLLDGSKFIGLYGSAYSTARAWGFWNEYKWLELARMIHLHDPEYVFVVIGAEWDLDLGRNLMSLLLKEKIPFINTIGEELGVVIEILRLLTYFFAFPSGLGILAPTISCPVTMFYPPHLKLMLNAWAAPEDIASGQYKGCLFCEPVAIFNWVKENGKI